MFFEFLESLAFEKELLIFGRNAKLLFDGDHKIGDQRFSALKWDHDLLLN
jgi:hypothetical protein